METWIPVLVALVSAIGATTAAVIAGRFASRTKAAELATARILRRFLHWVQIYGSDEAVTMALRFMQAIYHDPPPQILMRMIGDLILTARRELGSSETTIGPVEVLGMRINDIYEDEAVFRALTDPFEDVATRFGWELPWIHASPTSKSAVDARS